MFCEPSAIAHSNGPSTARSDEWPAWFSFLFSGCWRTLAKWHDVGGFCGIVSSLSGGAARYLAPGREDDHKKVQFIIISRWWLMKGTCGDMLVRHIEGTSEY